MTSMTTGRRPALKAQDSQRLRISEDGVLALASSSPPQVYYSITTDLFMMG